jgi:hypothetical protein
MSELRGWFDCGINTFDRFIFGSSSEIGEIERALDESWSDFLSEKFSQPESFADSLLAESDCAILYCWYFSSSEMCF